MSIPATGDEFFIAAEAVKLYSLLRANRQAAEGGPGSSRRQAFANKLLWRAYKK